MSINECKKIDNELNIKEQHVRNAQIKFEKTRFSWSKDSYMKSKEIGELPDHPFYQPFNLEEATLVQKISNFKPQMSLMELKDLKNHPKEEALRNAIDSLKRKAIGKRKKN